MPARPARTRIRSASFVLALTVVLTGLAGAETWHPRAASASPTPSPEVAAPGLSLTATANPTRVSRVGQSVAYAFVARNSGGQTLDDLVVQAPFAGLSALVCSPTPLGQALAAGASTTCRATRTTTVLDLRKSSLDDTARASARSGTTGLSATSRVQVAVKALPPVATNDSGFMVDAESTILLEGSHNDRPGEPGGPAIDPSRTVLVDPGASDGGKVLRLDYGTWTVQPDGRVQLARDFYSGNPGGSVTYRVVDVAGRAATARLTVTLLRSATATTDEVRVTQGRTSTVAVLDNDDPGEGRAGSPATFDLGSVRLAGGPPYAVLAPGGRRLTVPYAGTYVVTDAGKVTFTALPSFRGDSTVGYTATSSNTSSLRGSLHVTINRLTPKVKNERLITPYGRAVTFPAAKAALPGGESAPIRSAGTILVAPGVEPGGKRYVTRAGTWSVRTDGTVRFVPVSGYSGTSSVAYGVGDRNGTRGFADLTVTVRKGPKTVLVQGSTPVGVKVTLQPLSRATPGQRADGSAAAFDRTSLILLGEGLPPGSTVADAGRTLTVPGQGVWRVDPGTGSVSFAPGPAFVGAAATVTYQVRDTAGSTVNGRLAVAVVGSAPVATDDLASTPATAPVVVPGATNDRAGRAALRPGLTVFPPDGQPVGSSRAANGKTLTVPGQGTWVLGGDGSATFSPVPAFVGTTTAVGYRVTDAAGGTARASLRVVVQAGPTARPDTGRLGLSGAGVDISPLDNDIPGRNADGWLGSTDRTTLRLARVGQAPGWTVRENGLYAQHVSGLFVYVYPDSGQVDLNTFRASTAISVPLVYTVGDVALDAQGAVVHRTVSSTIQVEVPVRRPRANNDHAFTTSPFEVRLAGSSNDLPGDPSIHMSDDGNSTTFPVRQLAQLPTGSTIHDDFPNAVLTVRHQGQWVRWAYGSGDVTFIPEPGFVGETSPVTYLGRDSNGSQVIGTMQVTVRRGASARNDTARTPQGRAVTIDVLANDDPGLNPDGSPAVMDGGDVYFPEDALPPGATLEGDVATVPGEGRYSILPVSGKVVFRPEPGFTGTAAALTLELTVLVNSGDWHARAHVRSTVQVTVDPVSPVARADPIATGVGQPVVVPVLANDEPGVGAVPLVGPSVRLRLTPGLPKGSTVAGDAKSLAVPGRGVFLVSGTGQITFVPLGTTTGPVPAVGYQVADANGTTTRSSLKVSVR